MKHRRKLIAAAVGGISALIATALVAIPAMPAMGASSAATMTVFATGLNNPRGLEWGPDGNLSMSPKVASVGRHRRSGGVNR